MQAIARARLAHCPADMARSFSAPVVDFYMIACTHSRLLSPRLGPSDNCIKELMDPGELFDLADS